MIAMASTGSFIWRIPPGLGPLGRSLWESLPHVGAYLHAMESRDPDDPESETRLKVTGANLREAVRTSLERQGTIGQIRKILGDEHV